MIQLTMPAQHLIDVVEGVDPFRSRDEGRPILTSTLVRRLKQARKGGADLLEFWATDSYRAVRITVPVLDDVEVKDTQDQLDEGVMFALPALNLRAMTSALGGRGRRRRGAWWNYTLNLSSRSENSAFGLTSTGAWNGRGCYVSSDLEGDVPALGAGRRYAGSYPAIAGLFAEAEAAPVRLNNPVGFNSAYLVDLMRCAQRFTGDKAATLVLTSARSELKPVLLRTAQRHPAGLTFTALVMPVRVS